MKVLLGGKELINNNSTISNYKSGKIGNYDDENLKQQFLVYMLQEDFSLFKMTEKYIYISVENLHPDIDSKFFISHKYFLFDNDTNCFNLSELELNSKIGSEYKI